jgi:hypothetical protein
MHTSNAFSATLAAAEELILIFAVEPGPEGGIPWHRLTVSFSTSPVSRRSGCQAHIIFTSQVRSIKIMEALITCSGRN